MKNFNFARLSLLSLFLLQTGLSIAANPSAKKANPQAKVAAPKVAPTPGSQKLKVPISETYPYHPFEISANFANGVLTIYRWSQSDKNWVAIKTAEITYSDKSGYDGNSLAANLNQKILLAQNLKTPVSIETNITGSDILIRNHRVESNYGFSIKVNPKVIDPVKFKNMLPSFDPKKFTSKSTWNEGYLSTLYFISNEDNSVLSYLVGVDVTDQNVAQEHGFNNEYAYAKSRNVTDRDTLEKAISLKQRVYLRSTIGWRNNEGAGNLAGCRFEIIKNK